MKVYNKVPLGHKPVSQPSELQKTYTQEKRNTPAFSHKKKNHFLITFWVQRQ